MRVGSEDTDVLDCPTGGEACRKAQEGFTSALKAAELDLQSPEAWLELENYLFTVNQTRDPSLGTSEHAALCGKCPLKQLLD
ncbi:MAG: hypothetical protein AAFP28_03240 [Pseudomonadota bacterium]